MRIEYEPKHDIVNIQFLENVDIENRRKIEAKLIDNGYPIKIRNPKAFVEEVRI